AGGAAVRLGITFAAMAATLAAVPLLHTLFDGAGWWRPAVLAVVAVAVAGAAARAARLPGWAVPAVQAAAALCLLTALLAPPGTAWLGFVPSPAALAALRGLAGEGWGAILANPTPVPTGAGLMLVVALCLTLLALLVDLLAVTLYAAALTGPVLLAVLFVPLTVDQGGVGWRAFACAAGGYLLLLAVDGWERIAPWGTADPVGTPRWSRAGLRARLAALGGGARHLGGGAGIAAAALAVALLLPHAVPGLTEGAVYALAGGQRSGAQTVITTHPLVSLRRDLTSPTDRQVLEYRTSAARPEYLRVHVLDVFDGQSWTMSAVQAARRNRVADGDLPEPPGVDEDGGGTTAVTTEVAVPGTAARFDFLPLPYAARRVEVAGEWYVDPATLMVFSTQGEAAGLTYRVRSAVPDPDPAELGAARFSTVSTVDRGYLEVPDSVDPRVGELTRSIVSGAATPHARAVALQEWFTGGRFAYSLRPPAVPEGVDPLVDFLFDSRIGYCEQFAAAMALMARQAGVPARVAVGYTSGTRTADGRWVVTERNAHAWPELYFEGAGWLRFEPTPATAAGQPSATTPAYAVPADPGAAADEGGTEEERRPEAEPEPSAAAEPGPEDAATAEPAEPATGGATGSGAGWWVLVAVAALLPVLLAAPALARLARSRLRWARAGTPSARARAAWRELRADVLDSRLGWDPAETPRAAARRLAAQVGLADPARAALLRIASAEESARYAPVPEVPEDLAADSAAVRAALVAARSRRVRLRALLLPVLR
ncbi:DUF3488 and transglutaminase-like domain-containing protein, partial [Marinitenerispora sediminis]|uniref:DUF3488 and transglutaminase-like domain-containing protein n=1 Tax=Marinitenerispora sediminis TaxID=1931232 RepID=UPI001F47AB92